MTALLLALALCLVELPHVGAVRLADVLPGAASAATAGRRIRVPGRFVVPAAAGGAAVVVLLLGLPLLVALSAGFAGAAVARIAQGAAAERTRGLERDSAVVAIATVAAELRAGQQPDTALDTAAAATSGSVASVLGEAAAIARLAGSVPAVLQQARAAGPFRWLAAGWKLSSATGAGLATVLEDVARVGRASQQHDRQVAALLAGPRATAVLLAGLPVLGLGLGVTMGARPLEVLFHTRAGELVLLAGVLLELVGLAWTERIVRSAGASR